MKRLSYLMMVGLALVASVSCNKQLNSVEEPQAGTGRRVTLTASIGTAETKLGYEMDETGTLLKGSWDAEEAVSVIVQKSSSSTFSSIHRFSYSGPAGQRTVDFSCDDFPVLEEDDLLFVIYPAVGAGHKEGMYTYYDSATVCPDGTPLVRIEGLKSFYSVHVQSNQTADGDYSHIAGTSVLFGSDASVDESGKLSVTLTPQNSLFKVEMAFPEETIGQTIDEVELYAYSKLNALQSFGYLFARGATPETHFIVNLVTDSEYLRNNVKVALGELDPDATDGPATKGIKIPGNGKLTVFIPFSLPARPTKELSFGPDGAKVLVVRVKIGETTYNGGKTLKNTVPIEMGKMYRLNVALSDVVYYEES